MQLNSSHYDLAEAADAQEFYHSRGWTDGLPIVPPTSEAVQACLDWVGMSPTEIIGIEPVRERLINAEKLAINSVMAGCLPMHFPLVVTAWTALLREAFLLHCPTAITGGCALRLVINRPVRWEIGGQGVFHRFGSVDRSTSLGVAAL